VRIPRIGSRVPRTVQVSLLEMAAQEANSARRLAIYDRDSGLYAYWYFASRFRQETARCTRYNHPLSVVLVEVNQGPEGHSLESVQAWLSSELRSTDLLTHLGDGRFLAILIETDEIGAAEVVARLKKAFPKDVAVGAASWPEDGSSLIELQHAAQASAAIIRALPESPGSV
jgi:GGDEF domain-containing protein